MQGNRTEAFRGRGRVRGWLMREEVRLVLQLVGSLAVLFLLVGGVGFWLRPQLERLGSAFVDRFGLFGMALGTFLADAVQFPVAPQFYMLASMVRGGSQVVPLLAISGASMVAGCVGFLLARRGSSVRFLRRKLDKSRPVVDRMLGRYGAWTFVLLSVSPVPYSIVCYLMGMYRMPLRHLALFVGMRGPRLWIMYFVIRAAWGASR